MRKLLLFALLSVLFIGCVEQPSSYISVTGRVTKTYEVPSYKANSIYYHVVLKDFAGQGYDVIVSREQAAQYEAGDTITINVPIYR